MASSSSSSVQQKFQVFLSFRGEDTRNNFTSHLHEALKRKGIDAYVDYRLEKGEKIETLFTAIEESTISIIVLSENYASSSWCLDELSKILECMEKDGQKVVPIFYHVDPSDVRHIRGSFEKALEMQQERFKDKVEMWRAALVQLAGLSGHHLSGQPNDRYESEHIKDIVKDISKKLIYKSPNDFKVLVGIDSHIKEIESLLCFELADVRILGIWGMGGIGKTTVAEAIFHQISTEFEGCYFLANVREKSEKYGWICVRDELLCEILEERNTKIGTSLLPTFVLDRLRRKKVFIVLDDVDDSMQLDILLEKDYFGLGSRIIVTSRDKQVLRLVVDEMYEVRGLNVDKALKLFSLYAFKQNHPKQDFMELSKKVVYYANGVPLALKILGSSLFNKSKLDWEGDLKKLKEICNPNIDKILRINYDGLDHEVQDIFLDVSCFFKGMGRDYVTNILDGCYKSVWSGLNVLIDKSLITISPINELEMHDLLEQMGWNIVYRESKEPGKRSRLWTPEDIYHVLKNNTGTGRVIGMFLDMSKIRKVHLSPEAFARMYNLKFLKFYYSGSRGKNNVYLSQQRLESLSDNLSYLHWDGYPSKSLPSNFCPENLVELSMPYSHLKQLWNGVQNLVKLKTLDLSHSRHLIKIPDLSGATVLDRMMLDGCTSLVEVPSSIQYTNNLKFLSLNHCQNLGNFPSNINLRSLTTLSLTSCSNVREFPEISRNLGTLCLNGTAIEEVPSSIKFLSRLKDLDLDNCRRLRRLPSNINLRSLTTLVLRNCSNLIEFPEISRNLEELFLDGTAIEEVPSSIEFLSRLKDLDLKNCKRLRRLPSSICKLKFLQRLNLNGCLKLESFPEILETMEYLLWLHLCHTSIKELPSSIEHLDGLFSLELDDCEKLKNLPSSIRKLKSLNTLSLRNCSNITNFPEISRSLWKLDLSGCAIEQVPSIVCLSELRKLKLDNCEKLGSLPRNILKSKSLCLRLSGFSKWEVIEELLGDVQVLNVCPSIGTAKIDFNWAEVGQASLSLSSSFNGLVSLQNNIGNMNSLQQLSLFGVSVLDTFLDNLESLKSLKYLCLSSCNLFVFPSRLTLISSLRELDLSENNFETIPPSIKQLLNLEKLDLSCCQRLQSLPELPPNLNFLIAHDCTSLEAVSSPLPTSYRWDQTFMFKNCFNLNQNAILAVTQLSIQQKAIEDVKLFHEIQDQRLLDFSPIRICFPGNEIPEWFNCQNLGSSVTIMLPPHLHDHKFMGFALCAVVPFGDFNFDFGFKVFCRWDFKTNGGDEYCSSSCLLSWDELHPRFIGSDHVFLYYDFDLYQRWYNGERNYQFNEASFEFYLCQSECIRDSCMVSKCGVCLLYAQDDLTCGVMNQDFVQPMVGHGINHETGNESGSSNLLNAQTSSPYDPSWLSLKCGLSNSLYDYRYNEAERSGNFSSDEEEEPHPKRLKNV